MNDFSQIPNCFYRISIKGLILDEQKRFLLCKEDNGLRELPGGGLDRGENPREGLKREIFEEMGLEVTKISEQPQYFIVCPSQTKKAWISNILYRIETKNLDITKSEECQEIGFFTREEASKLPLFNNVKEFLKVYNPHNH